MAASATPAYLWEGPGRSIWIHISLSVVERLGGAIRQGLGPGPRGLEIGGILLGRMAPGVRTVLIEDFWLVPSGHWRGASYTLSSGERHALGARLARCGPRQAVGYFRSHTRQGLYLDQDDFAIIRDYFPDPAQVFLLVKPSAHGVTSGGFFYWEDGDINRKSAYRPFPFDCQRLLANDYPIVEWPAPQKARISVPAPRLRLSIPQVPLATVPVLAGLFLVAGLFESRHYEPPPTPVTSPAPRIQPAAPPVLAEVLPDMPASPERPATTRRVSAKPQPKSWRAPASVRAHEASARGATRKIEPPPTLAAPVAHQLEMAAAMAPRTALPIPPRGAEVTYTIPFPSVFRRVVHKISPFGEAPAASAFVPPSPIHKVIPAVPPDATASERAVDVKVYIDESGNVSRARLLTRRNRLADPSLNAARQWQFAPAHKGDQPVSSELVLHFRFGGAVAVD